MSSEDLAGATSGAVLAKAREENNFSQREVAEALRLPVDVVDALERGQKELLPAFVFTRGYVRAYARLLELDQEPLVASLAAEYGEAAVEEAQPVVREDAGEPMALSLAQLGGLAALALVILAGLIYALTSSDEAPADAVVEEAAPVETIERGARDATPPNSTAGTEQAQDAAAGFNNAANQPGTGRGESVAAEQPLEESAPLEDVTTDAATARVVESASPRIQRAQNEAPEGADVRNAQDEPQQVRSADSPTPVQDSAIAVLDRSAPIGQQDESSDDAEADSASVRGVLSRGIVTSPVAVRDESMRVLPQRNIGVPGSDRIRLDVTEECWIEIKNLDDRVLFGDLGRPGTSLRFQGQGPFRILLGYAHGIEMYYNDDRVALAPHTRNNVANLVVGQ